MIDKEGGVPPSLFAIALFEFMLMLFFQIIIAFISIIALILYILYRRAALSRLPAMPAEIVICEERGVAVVEKRIRYYHYGSCLVRFTDRRIVIAYR